MIADLGSKRSAARQWPAGSTATRAHKQPFFDDFNDGNYTGWTVSGTMSASNNYLASTGTGAPIASKSNTDGDNEITLRYRIENTSDSLTRAYIDYRFTDWNNYEWVRIFPSQINIGKNVAGVGTQIASGSATSTANTWYNLRIVADGATVKVWRWADGAMPTLICSTTSSPNLSTSAFKISVNTGYLFDFDDIRILADSLSNTTTFAVNNANELTTVADFNGTTTFGFDDWGRMTSKARGSYSATYGYKYGDLVDAVTTNWPTEANVTYRNSGTLQLRSRTSSGVETRYRYMATSTTDVLSEEDSTGNLLRSYVGEDIGIGLANFAVISGSDPALGSARYVEQDYLGSVHGTRDNAKNLISFRDYSPYGEELNTQGESNRLAYTGRFWDRDARFYTFAYRNYSPGLGRWLSADPAGMADGTNIFGYVANNPVSLVDKLGLGSGRPGGTIPRPEPGSPNRLVPRHGKYCGPEWTQGEWVNPNNIPPLYGYPPPENGNRPLPTSRLDECCESHDARYAECRAAHRENPRDLRRCYHQADRCLAGCSLGKTPSPRGLHFSANPRRAAYRVGLTVVFMFKGGGVSDPDNAECQPISSVGTK